MARTDDRLPEPSWVRAVVFRSPGELARLGLGWGGEPQQLADSRLGDVAVARQERLARDLVCEVPIGIVQAALGGTVDVPTLEGKATITLPAGTRSGQRFRIRRRGIPATAGQAEGDLFAVIQIVPPKNLDARSRQLLEEFARLNPTP